MNQRFHTQNQRNQRNLYCWHPYVRVRASIFHPRKKIGLSPRRPCGSDEPCPRFARSPGAALGCSTSPLHDPACCFAFLVRPCFLATTNIYIRSALCLNFVEPCSCAILISENLNVRYKMLLFPGVFCVERLRQTVELWRHIYTRNVWKNSKGQYCNRATLPLWKTSNAGLFQKCA